MTGNYNDFRDWADSGNRHDSNDSFDKDDLGGWDNNND